MIPHTQTNKKQLVLVSHSMQKMGNRVYTVKNNYEFNGYILKKGLTSDGGSIPKILILALFLILKEIYQFHWLTNIIIFAIAIDESSGWFQKPFFAHDQRWNEAKNWKDIFKANWLFYKDMIYKVQSYQTKYNEYYFKALFHIPIGYILCIMYPLAVSTFGLVIAYFKIKNND